MGGLVLYTYSLAWRSPVSICLGTSKSFFFAKLRTANFNGTRDQKEMSEPAADEVAPAEEAAPPVEAVEEPQPPAMTEDSTEKPLEMRIENLLRRHASEEHSAETCVLVVDDEAAVRTRTKQGLTRPGNAQLCGASRRGTARISNGERRRQKGNEGAHGQASGNGCDWIWHHGHGRTCCIRTCVLTPEPVRHRLACAISAMRLPRRARTRRKTEARFTSRLLQNSALALQ